KSGHDPGKDGPDPSRTEDSYGTAYEIEAHESVEVEVAFASAVVGPRDLAVEREQQADGKLGHGVRRIVGDAHDLDAKVLRGVQVDMIEAGGARRHEPGAASAESLQHAPVDAVVHEDADGGEPVRQGRRVGSQQRFEIDELLSVTTVELGKQGALVGSR